MNTKVKLALLKQLSLRTSHQGNTVIELLIVVIIIGILAAIALPNLLGQVGKARESEAKSQVGAVNRAQQAYYTEYSEFAISSDNLEVPFGTPKYYSFTMGSTPAAAGNVAGTIWAANPATGGPAKGNAKNGTRDYTGGTAYDSATRNFYTVVCRANNAQKPDFVLSLADVNAGVGSGNTATCGNKTVAVK